MYKWIELEGERSLHGGVGYFESALVHLFVTNFPLRSCLGVSKTADVFPLKPVVVWHDGFKTPVGTMHPPPCSLCSYSLASWSSYISSSFALPHRATAHRYFLSTSPMPRSPVPPVSLLGRTSPLLRIPRAPSQPGLTRLTSVESLAW